MTRKRTSGPSGYHEAAYGSPESSLPEAAEAALAGNQFELHVRQQALDTLKAMRIQAHGTRRAFCDLLSIQPIDPYTIGKLAALFHQMARCQDDQYSLITKLVDELLGLAQNIDAGAKAVRQELRSIIANHRKGPDTKHDRVRKRHEAMDRAWDLGIREEAALYNFMRENHPELMRVAKRLISPARMMKAYRQHRGV